MFFLKDQFEKQYPDGKYPAVGTPEHIRQIGIWGQQWKNISKIDRRPYDQLAEGDRERYFDELEKWKHDLAKPENESDLHNLERLSKKIEQLTRKTSAVQAEKEKKLRDLKKKRAIVKALAKRAKRKRSTSVGSKKSKNAGTKKVAEKCESTDDVDQTSEH